MSGPLPPPPGEPPAALTGPSAPPSNGSGGRGYDRVPPHSLEAEVSVLGAALLSRTAASEADEILRADDFYRNAHRLVFEGVQALLATGEPIDTVTLTDWLARQDRLDEVGGAAAIHDLTVAVPTAANAAYYARIVRDRALMRRLIDAGTQVARLGYEATEDATAVVDRAESIVFEVAQTRGGTEYSVLGELLNESFEQIEKLAERGSEVTGLATGFDDLDRLTAGLQPQNLIILAARPAMGKCVVGGTRLVDPTSGRRWRLQDLVEQPTTSEDAAVLTLDGEQRLVATRPSARHANGTKPVFRVRTRSGRTLTATANHPLLTWDGWRPLEELTPGTPIAVPRRLEVSGTSPRADAEVILLAYLLGDGCLTGATPTLTTASSMIETEARQAAAAFGTRCARRPVPGTDAVTLTFSSTTDRITTAQVAEVAGVSTWTVTSARTGSGHVAAATRARIAEVERVLGDADDAPADWLRWWLEELGIRGHAAGTKFVPDVVFTLPNEQVALFLSRLFATDGSAWVAEGHGYSGISYCSGSEQLVQDVQHLLLRFGILSSIRERWVRYLDGRNRAFELEIRDAANVRRFLDEIGIFSKEAACERVRRAIDRRSGPHSNTDLLPREVWELILAEKGSRSWAEVSVAAGMPRSHNWHVGRRRPSRRTVARLAQALESPKLHAIATSDVLWDPIESITPAGEAPVYDLTVPDTHNFVADDIVVHNSSLVLGISQFVAVKLRRPAIIFSLEMSKLEIVNRLLSSEARIDSSRLRTGRLEDADWRKLGDALGTLSEAPLFIDDTPSISLMEIRAKCRRLKQRHGLDLVIVDYLQLMQSHRRVDSRQQEVAEISRGLKMLAKELDVPVIALSQLSRQPESRTDKRPQLADLRESGCLTRETRLFRADSGLPVTFGQLLDEGLTDIPVWATDRSGRLVSGQLTHAFRSGVKPVFRVRLRSGMTVDATANHPFRTLHGWSPLGELTVGSRVAGARRIPAPSAPEPMDPDELVLLAHLIGEGTIVARQPIHYTSADEGNLQAVEKAAWHRFRITAVRRPDGRSASTTQLYLPAPFHLTHGRRNPIAAWLDELGLWDRRSYDKRLPAAVFGLPDDQVRTFLHHLWATDGCLHVRREGGRGRRVSLYYATSSEQLAHDLQLLLLRLGLHTLIRRTQGAVGRPSYQVWLDGVAQQRRFLTEVGVHGARGERIPAALTALREVRSNPNRDVLPIEVWEVVRQAWTDRGMTERTFQAALGMAYCGSTLYRAAPSRERLARAATALGGHDWLQERADDDLYWDEIVAIEPRGDHAVFDATVAEHHSFVAEGLVLHNSIEQDADIVGFIYRDEVYDEDSPDKGIAELIISKHRNGATGVVKLAFLNHLTKFANLARGSSGGAGGTGAGGTPTPV
jgi:replicative DNA helicase